MGDILLTWFFVKRCLLLRHNSERHLVCTCRVECPCVTSRLRGRARFGEMQTTSNPLVLGSTDRRVERLLKNINLHPSVPSDLNHAAISNSFLSKTVVRDVWRQQALLQLLQVAEISMLDCILSSPAKPEPLRSSHRNHGDLVISNTCVDREVLTASRIMESMLNKLKSTVTKVTADVTSAVMGNPVTREFEVGRHIASGGPGMSWRIYNGTKKSTKQEVAVFVFDKKIIDRYQKFEKDQIIDSLKKGVQQLTRLRHPRLLTVQHPLEESRDCLAFCTEPVFASLANVLGQWDNLPSPVPTDIKEYKLYDVETKYGLLQVSEGLSFLHSGVKMVHGNLCPENIILNKSGAWKIMGFDFSISSSNPSDAEPKYVCKEWDPNLPPLCLANPEYVAPEYILSVSCDAASDMYSLGVLIHAVFNEGKPVFQVNKQDIYKSFSRQLDQLSRLSPGLLSKIPEEVREHVKMLLSVTSNVRPDADQMTKIPFFDDVGAMTLQYFDSLFQRDNLQKSQFYKSLPKVLPKLPKARTNIFCSAFNK
ncbi:hypothetical protein cypCar_00036126 [Cyprinus carpio]|nr:hypothetical protein cypCar_00036126 [Cyprinus carpio]